MQPISAIAHIQVRISTELESPTAKITFIARVKSPPAPIKQTIFSSSFEPASCHMMLYIRMESSIAR